MREFRYERAADPAAAVALLAGEPEGSFLGGGTNLVDLMKLGVATPGVLVDVRQLTSADVTDLPDGGLRIGAAVPNADLAGDGGCASVSPSWRRRCSRVPPASCATARRPAATCCSAPGAATSPT
jgi:CO/xanthine dehydrogenase FAD-binding subunit